MVWCGPASAHESWDVSYLLGVGSLTALRVHRDLVCDQKAGVETHAELPDQGHVRVALHNTTEWTKRSDQCSCQIKIEGLDACEAETSISPVIISANNRER